MYVIPYHRPLCHEVALKKQWCKRSYVIIVLFTLWVTPKKPKKKTTMERERKLTFKVLTSAHSASSWLTPPLSTLLKVLPSSGSWSCGNSKPSKLNFNARSQVNPKPKCSSCPCFSSVGDGGEWKRREWRRKKLEGGRWVDGRKGSR